jgi:hypothetical protein
MGIRPPGLENVQSWNQLSAWMQAKILAFSMILDYEEDERREMLLKVIARSPGL